MNYFLHYTNLFSGIILVVAGLILLHCIFKKRKELFLNLKEIPGSLIGLHLFFLVWGLFMVVKNFSRGEFGVWLMSTTNMNTFSSLLSTVRTPVYHFRSKILAEIFGGISYEFISNVNFIGFIIASLLIYRIVFNLVKNKQSAYAASIFFLTSPVMFTFSLIEDYALLALFFMIVSLFFISMSIKEEDSFYVLPAMATALLSAGSRVEYIIFPYLFILLFLILSNRKDLKKNILLASGFGLLVIPRTISTVSMYFLDAQQDVALHGTTYEYTGNPITYIMTVIRGSANFFIENMQDSFRILTNPRDLTLLFLILSIMGFFVVLKKESRRIRRVYAFFIFQFIVLVLYYSYFHAVNGIRAYRYLITIITPLMITAGISFGLLTAKRKSVFFGGLQILLIFSFITVLFPLSFRQHSNLILDRRLDHFINSDFEQVRREYYAHKELSYENRVSSIFNDDFDIKGGSDSYFIINGERSLLHSMPIDGNFIGVSDIERISELADHIPKEANIYASQSEMGFTSHRIDGYSNISVDPKKFEDHILDNFIVEKKIISYEIEDRYDIDHHHAFLFKLKHKTR